MRHIKRLESLKRVRIESVKKIDFGAVGYKDLSPHNLRRMNFKEAVDIIIGLEGGYVFHPKDPGGETNFGISKRQYPNLDIKNLTESKAKDIYKNDYWDKVKCENLPESLRLLVFDAAVNQGVPTASKILQRVLGVKQDGIIGPVTLKALSGIPELIVLCRYSIERHKHYTANSNWQSFGKGWSKRLLEISLYSSFVFHEEWTSPDVFQS